MAGAKEIRGKIASVKSTQKITKAMEMVASSKMRKTQDRMFASRPYSSTILRTISHLSLSNGLQSNHFFKEREIKKVGFLIISTDRGLCGGLNINLFKHVLGEINKFKQQNVEVKLGLLGSKAVGFFSHLGLSVEGQITGMTDDPSIEQILGIANTMFEKYESGEIDAIYLAYNNFINTMVQKTKISQLVPVTNFIDDNFSDNKVNWDYEYEPSAEYLLNKLLKRYLESQIYQAVVENLASEQAARMVAMKAATDNAGNLIDDLQLVYNKARQTSITNELNEIVAGAAAI